eukprot:987494-Pyramimonas_sp.AAC.1
MISINSRGASLSRSGGNPSGPGALPPWIPLINDNNPTFETNSSGPEEPHQEGVGSCHYSVFVSLLQSRTCHSQLWRSAAE